MNRHFALITALVSFGTFAPPIARAQEIGPAYRISVDVDVPVLLIGVSLASNFS
jgi:hypothetical protein